MGPLRIVYSMENWETKIFQSGQSVSMGEGGGEGAPNAYILWKSIALAIFQGGGGSPEPLFLPLNLPMRQDILLDLIYPNCQTERFSAEDKIGPQAGTPKS